jgi:two-component system cell cycle response regulator
VTVSVGVSSLLRRADTAEALMKRADIALYEAKSRGRNRVVAKAA